MMLYSLIQLLEKEYIKIVEFNDSLTLILMFTMGLNRYIYIIKYRYNVSDYTYKRKGEKLWKKEV